MPGIDMDEKTQKKVEATVLEILRESVTEYKVRTAAANRLGIDLSLPDRKLFVRRILEDYLRSLPEEEEQLQQGGEEGKNKQEEHDEKEGAGGKKEYGDKGELILCRLSTKRMVTLQDFRGKTLVSIREYYSMDGKELPTAKGISLTVEQWEAFRDSIPAIEDAIKNLGESD